MVKVYLAWSVTLCLYCQHCRVNLHLSESQLSDTLIIQTPLLSYTLLRPSNLLCFLMSKSSMCVVGYVVWHLVYQLYNGNGSSTPYYDS